MEKKRKKREREREIIKREERKNVGIFSGRCRGVHSKKKKIIDWDGIPIRIPQSVIKMPSSFIAFRPR